jgi:hypothetical protein
MPSYKYTLKYRKDGRMDYKYGIRCLDLAKKYPSLIDDCKLGKVKWETASDYITGCISTFMLLIAHIKYNDLTCYSCSYPNSYASDYIVLTAYDNQVFLVSILKDNGFYPDNSDRIQMLKDGLLLLDCDQTLLNGVYEALCHNRNQS